MEESRNHAGFFFEDSAQRIDGVFDFARKKFRNVFGDKQPDKSDAPGRPCGGVIQSAIEDRHNTICWLADNDPGKIDGFSKMPVLEYWSILDNKIAENKKALAKARAEQGKK